MTETDDGREVELQKELAECIMSGSSIFCLSGVLLSIPWGIRSKSFYPLVFLGGLGTILDMIDGYNKCSKQREALKAYQDAAKFGLVPPDAQS